MNFKYVLGTNTSSLMIKDQIFFPLYSLLLTNNFSESFVSRSLILGMIINIKYKLITLNNCSTVPIRN